MNAKIKKVIGEMEKVQAKIDDLQARLEELGKEKIKLENLEIISLYRGANVTEEEFKAFLEGHRTGGVPFVLQQQEETYHEEV